MAKFRDQNGLEWTVSSHLDLPNGTYTDSNGRGITIGNSSVTDSTPPSTVGVKDRLNAELEAEWEAQGGSANQGYPLGGVGGSSAYGGLNLNSNDPYAVLLNQLNSQKTASKRKQDAAIDARNEALEASLAALETQRQKADNDYEDNASAAYTAYLKQQKRMPQIFRANGLTGGMSESSAVQMEGNYTANQNAVRNAYNSALDNIGLAEAQARAGASADIAELERQYNDEQIDLTTQINNAYLNYANQANAPVSSDALNQGVVLLRSLGAGSPQVQRWLNQNNVTLEELQSYSAYSAQLENQAKAASAKTITTSDRANDLNALLDYINAFGMDDFTRSEMSRLGVTEQQLVDADKARRIMATPTTQTDSAYKPTISELKAAYSTALNSGDATMIDAAGRAYFGAMGIEYSPYKAKTNASSNSSTEFSDSYWDLSSLFAGTKSGKLLETLDGNMELYRKMNTKEQNLIYKRLIENGVTDEEFTNLLLKHGYVL